MRSVTLSSLALIAALSVGCSQQRASDRAEQAEDKARQAGNAVENSMNKAGDALKNSSEKAGQAASTATERTQKALGSAGEKLQNAWQRAKIKVNNANIDVDESNGVVTLTGTVDSEIDKQKAEQEARKMEGVTDVVNNIQVSGEAGAGGKPTAHGDVRKRR